MVRNSNHFGPPPDRSSGEAEGPVGGAHLTGVEHLGHVERGDADSEMHLNPAFVGVSA